MDGLSEQTLRLELTARLLQKRHDRPIFYHTSYQHIFPKRHQRYFSA